MLSALALTTVGAQRIEYVSLANLREENRDSIAKVRNGMSRTEVLRVLGNKEAPTKHGNPVRNPFRVQTFSGSDGIQYEAMLFYTERHAKFGRVRDSNCTPVILRNDTVIGIGLPLLQKLRGW